MKSNICLIWPLSNSLNYKLIDCRNTRHGGCTGRIEMVSRTGIISVLLVLLPEALFCSSFDDTGHEIHIGVGGSVYMPIHYSALSAGYSIYVTLRPPYAGYLYEELERYNLGLSWQSITQYIDNSAAFYDVCITLRYYINDGEFGPRWESGYIGAGCGYATVFWDGVNTSGKRRDLNYIIEAGYELDLYGPFVLSFNVHYRLIDIEPVSFSGMGVNFNLCYGVGQ